MFPTQNHSRDQAGARAFRCHEFSLFMHSGLWRVRHGDKLDLLVEPLLNAAKRLAIATCRLANQMEGTIHEARGAPSFRIYVD